MSCQTRITQLFGIELPIVAGGLMWLANADYVAAAARSGIMAYLSASTFPDADALRQEIRKCRALAEGRPFGVNVSMLPNASADERTQSVFALIADEGIRFVETSGRNPEAFIPFLKYEGIIITHKVASVRHAAKAESIGVDAVAIVGAECGGHPGMDMVGTFVNAAWARDALRIPYLIGGGIGHGSQITAALSMGADGVLMGTRFLAAQEIWAHDDYKQLLVRSQPTDTALCMTSVRNPIRVLKNETVANVLQLEQAATPPTIDMLMPLVAGHIGRNAYLTGDCRRGLLSAGHALAFIKAIEPIHDIVERLSLEMQQSMLRLAQLAPPAVLA